MSFISASEYIEHISIYNAGYLSIKAPSEDSKAEAQMMSEFEMSASWICLDGIFPYALDMWAHTDTHKENLALGFQ